MRPDIKLPCGCRINDATVLAMCIGHSVEINQWRLEQAQAYREFVNRMSLAEASSCVRTT